MCDTKYVDHDVERKELVAVAAELVLDVEGSGVKRFADLDRRRWRDKQKHRVGIDEPPDQPGAGDTIDLRSRARNPDGAALRVAGGEFRCRHQRKLGGFPALKTAFERFGFDVEGSPPRRGALRQFFAP